MQQQETEPNHERRAVQKAEKPAPENQMTLRAMAKHIELWPVDRLIPFARNPRTHSDAQVAQIAASIAEFGFNRILDELWMERLDALLFPIPEGEKVEVRRREVFFELPDHGAHRIYVEVERPRNG